MVCGIIALIGPFLAMVNICSRECGRLKGASGITFEWQLFVISHLPQQGGLSIERKGQLLYAR
jgi:hypothetical protein